jgi:hypothetical protein
MMRLTWLVIHHFNATHGNPLCPLCLCGATALSRIIVPAAERPGADALVGGTAASG